MTARSHEKLIWRHTKKVHFSIYTHILKFSTGRRFMYSSKFSVLSVEFNLLKIHLKCLCCINIHSKISKIQHLHVWLFQRRPNCQVWHSDAIKVAAVTNAWRWQRQWADALHEGRQYVQATFDNSTIYTQRHILLDICVAVRVRVQAIC